MAEAAETQPLLPGRIRRHGMKGFGYDRDALFLVPTLHGWHRALRTNALILEGGNVEIRVCSLSCEATLTPGCSGRGRLLGRAKCRAA
jgi:hypothetical protein